ncbi:MAG TPA: DedA family protein [Vicinamibacterales bacterium]
MFEWINETIRALGYSGVAVLTFLENLFPPIPSEIIIPLAGFVAARGDMRVWGVIVAGSFGSLVGALVWYEVGRRLGETRLRAWVDRHGKWLTLTARDVDRAQDWFRRHGRTSVLVGRMVPGVRTFVSLPAGFARMSMGAFLVYSAVGTIAWTAALAYAGVALRANYARVGDYVGVATNIVFAVLGIMLVRRYIKCWSPSSPE